MVESRSSFGFMRILFPTSNSVRSKGMAHKGMRPGRALCDGCGKVRSDVRSCGRDSNGDPDAPDLCFICRKEGERRRVYDFKKKRYVSYAEKYGDELPF
jgi:hypothetical protein